MTKLSFFSIPRNQTRSQTIEVIKNALIVSGWKFVKNQKGVRRNLESVQTSCRNLTDLHILFKEYPETMGLRTLTETQKSHRQGRAIVLPCLF